MHDILKGYGWSIKEKEIKGKAGRVILKEKVNFIPIYKNIQKYSYFFPSGGGKTSKSRPIRDVTARILERAAQEAKKAKTAKK